MRISDWSSDVCSSDLNDVRARRGGPGAGVRPAVARGDKAQFGQPEIEHRARRRPDIFTKLGPDKHDDGRRGGGHPLCVAPLAAALIVAANSSKSLASVKSRKTLANRQ